MEGNSINTFENLCKIFEMRIKLDKAKGEVTSREVIDNYENYAQKIDSYYNEEFQNKLKSIISPEKTLDKERKRLEELIELLEDRLQKRNFLVDSFYGSTGKYIRNLQLIVSDNELNNKKERLSLITKYLDTVKEIDDIKDSIEKLNDSLSIEKVKKEDYLAKNKILEDELYSSFVTSINNDTYYENIEEENISSILSEVIEKAKEAKETLDITEESVKSLLSSGMDDEYESYIDEARKNYSLWKDREIILKIYKLVIEFEDEFDDILEKRNVINGLLDERNNISLDDDKLLELERVMLEQNEVLTNEKEVLDNVSNYTNRIEFKTERLNELEEVIKEPEILVILSEYNMVNETSDDEYSFETDGNDNEEIINENIINREYNPYEIVSIDDYPATLNISLAKLKGASVRDKVNRKLNPEEISIPSFDSLLTEDEKINNISDNELKSESSNNDEKEDTISLKDDSDKEDSLPESISGLDIILPKLNNELDEKNIDVDNKDMEEEKNDADSTDNNNNSFWIPVSDSKIETSDFPNINITTPNEQLKLDDDNFGFPEFNS